ncbi:hypothetical protein RHECNPAF_730051 [Rhizobium etli CNPAF512]|nr:hypothetical protein RHECNPAF_730051 [Rhizobium etli CNPAF512]
MYFGRNVVICISSNDRNWGVFTIIGTASPMARLNRRHRKQNLSYRKRRLAEGCALPQTDHAVKLDDPRSEDGFNRDRGHDAREDRGRRSRRDRPLDPG